MFDSKFNTETTIYKNFDYKCDDASNDKNQCATEVNDYDELFLNSEYYDTDSINKKFNTSNPQKKLLFMHFNMRSLLKNVDKLHEFLTDLKTRPAVIAISETKLKESKIANNINLQGYNFIHYDSKTSAGGVGLYINKLLVYNSRNDLRLNLDRVEDLWNEITVNNKPYVVGVIYRHPACSMAELDTFSKSVYDTLHNLNLKKTNFCILGDFNIDLSRIREYNNTRNYADNLLSCSVKCVIDQPTRVTAYSKTLLDHIYVNSRQQNVSGGIAVSDISDHFPTFAVIEIKAGQKNKLIKFSHAI